MAFSRVPRNLTTRIRINQRIINHIFIVKRHSFLSLGWPWKGPFGFWVGPEKSRLGFWWPWKGPFGHLDFDIILVMTFFLAGLAPDTPTMLRNGGHNAATKFFAVVMYGLMISKKEIHLDSRSLEREAYLRWLSKPWISWNLSFFMIFVIFLSFQDH